MNLEEIREKDRRRILEHMAELKRHIKFNNSYYKIRSNEKFQDYFTESLEVYVKFRELGNLFQNYRDDYGTDEFLELKSEGYPELIKNLKSNLIKFIERLS